MAAVLWIFAPSRGAQAAPGIVYDWTSCAGTNTTCGTKFTTAATQFDVTTPTFTSGSNKYMIVTISVSSPSVSISSVVIDPSGRQRGSVSHRLARQRHQRHLRGAQAETDAADSTRPTTARRHVGCACGVARRPPHTLAPIAGLLLALALRSRRRR